MTSGKTIVGCPSKNSNANPLGKSGGSPPGIRKRCSRIVRKIVSVSGHSCDLNACSPAPSRLKVTPLEEAFATDTDLSI